MGLYMASCRAQNTTDANIQRQLAPARPAGRPGCGKNYWYVICPGHTEADQLKHSERRTIIVSTELQRRRQGAVALLKNGCGIREVARMVGSSGSSVSHPL